MNDRMPIHVLAVDPGCYGAVSALAHECKVIYMAPVGRKIIHFEFQDGGIQVKLDNAEMEWVTL